jgi:hypothetical protein
VSRTARVSSGDICPQLVSTYLIRFGHNNLRDAVQRLQAAESSWGVQYSCRPLCRSSSVITPRVEEGRPDRKAQRSPSVFRPSIPCKRYATHPYVDGRLVMGVPAAPTRTTCNGAPALSWPRLQPVGECSSSLVGSFGCLIDILPGSDGRRHS